MLIGVRPSLPVEGVAVILGNNLAGARVWGNAPPAPVVCPDPAPSGVPDDCEQCFPAVFSACAVTRSRSCAVLPGRGEDVSPEVFGSSSASVPLLVDLPRAELLEEQWVDPGLTGLFGLVVPFDQLGSVREDRKSTRLNSSH